MASKNKDWSWIRKNLQTQRTYDSHGVFNVYSHRYPALGSAICRLKPTADKRGDINPRWDLHDCFSISIIPTSGQHTQHVRVCDYSLQGFSFPRNMYLRQPWLVCLGSVHRTCQVLQWKWFVAFTYVIYGNIKRWIEKWEWAIMLFHRRFVLCAKCMALCIFYKREY